MSDESRNEGFGNDTDILDEPDAKCGSPLPAPPAKKRRACPAHASAPVPTDSDDDLGRDARANSESLVPLDDINFLAIYTTGGIDNLIVQIETAARSLILDPDTEQGRAEIKSHAYKIARAKTRIDGAGKEIVDEWKTKAAKIDTERRKVRDRMDALKDEIRKPVTEWEAKQERIAEEARRAEEVRQEAERQAETERVAAIERELAEMREKERLRLESEEKARVEKERAEQVEREKQEAAERARVEAEEKAKLEIEEAKRREEEARVVAEKAERERKEAVERAEREKKDAEEKAERDRKEAAARAEREKQEAIDAERRRAQVEAERKERERADAEARATAERERVAADKKHRARIVREAIEDVSKSGLTTEDANNVVETIYKGMIRHVKITF